jgi:hypothetical protein
LINPKFVLVFSTGPKSMKHKYELLLNGRKMSESVEIVKSTIFFVFLWFLFSSSLIICKPKTIQKVNQTECIHNLVTLSLIFHNSFPGLISLKVSFTITTTLSKDGYGSNCLIFP